MFSTRLTVDRVEGDLARVEFGDHTFDWPLSALPPGATEGQSWTVDFKVCDPGSTNPDRLDRLRAANPDHSNDIDL